jgi:hypothetical protein
MGAMTDSVLNNDYLDVARILTSHLHRLFEVFGRRGRAVEA